MDADVDRDSVHGYYTDLGHVFELATNGSTETINVFAVIAGFTMIKESRGSHKYSVSFALVDPSRPSRAGAVFLIWFSNTLDGLHMKFKIGDIIRIEKARVQQFNGFPQLVAKDSNGSVTIFHRGQDPLTCAATHPLAPLPPSGATVDSAGAVAISTGNRVPFVDETWQTTTIGVFDTNSGHLSKKVKQSLPQPSADRPPLLWPEEVARLYSLHAWATDLFRKHSFSEGENGVHNSSLHTLQVFLHHAHNSSQYAQLQPVVEEALGQPYGIEGPRSHPIQNGKCDVVCLVTSVVQPSELNGNRAGMTIWDGTTNGIYTVASSCRQAVQIALDAPVVYESCLAAGADEVELRKQQTDLYLKEVHPRRLLGSAVRVFAEDPKFNAHITRCKPGMWVRIRNLHPVIEPAQTTGASSSSSGTGGGLANASTVRADSAVCQIGPDFADVRAIVRYNTERTARTFLQQVAISGPGAAHTGPARASAQAASATATASTPAAAVAAAARSLSRTTAPEPSAVTAAPVPIPTVVLPPQPTNNEPITSLALVRSGPAPAKYCVKGRIDSWTPANIHDFVSGSNRGSNGGFEATFMFALRVTDGSDYIQVLFQGAEAEGFLGAAAGEILTSAAARDRVARRLQACKDLGVVCEYKVKVVVDKEVVAIPQPVSANGAHGSNINKRGRGAGGRAKDAPEQTYVRKHRRMIAYDVQAPVLPEDPEKTD